jgi:hypothetical protein
VHPGDLIVIVRVLTGLCRTSPLQSHFQGHNDAVAKRAGQVRDEANKTSQAHVCLWSSPQIAPSDYTCVAPDTPSGAEEVYVAVV